ncbi:hypothetical protein Hanom_Chr00s002038g01690811 [Helianthus anomalus]
MFDLEFLVGMMGEYYTGYCLCVCLIITLVGRSFLHLSSCVDYLQCWEMRCGG